MCNKKMLLLVMFAVFVVNACSNDDDNDQEVIVSDPTGSFSLPEQPLHGNVLTVENLEISDPGWIVVRRDNGSNEPLITEIISLPKYLAAGTYPDITLELKDEVKLIEGERIWVNLHIDDGDKVFEYEENLWIDHPLMYPLGGLVTHSFIVDLPDPTGEVLVEDQSLQQDANPSVTRVTNSHPGWVVIYPDSEGAPKLNEPLSIPLYLAPGTHEDLEIELREDVELSNSQLLWVVLHSDNGDEVFDRVEEEGGDPVVVDSLNEIVAGSFVIRFDWVTGSLQVNTQNIKEDGTLLMTTVTLNTDGWLVLYRGNFGEPFLTERISEPLYLKAGTYQDVEVSVLDGFEFVYSEHIWAALYSDDGDQVYEFTQSGLADPPLEYRDGTPVAKRFTAYEVGAPQYFLLFYYYSGGVSALPTAEIDTGWLVVYRDNGNHAPDMTQAVSAPLFLGAEASVIHISIEVEETVSAEEVLWIVLHSDDGDQVFEYESTGNIDLPDKDANGAIIREAFTLGGLSWF